MRLQPGPFADIKNESKQMEYRLYDKKKSRIQKIQNMKEKKILEIEVLFVILMNNPPPMMWTRLLSRLNIEEQILIVNYVNTMMMKKQYVVKIVQMHLLMD